MTRPVLRIMLIGLAVILAISSVPGRAHATGRPQGPDGGPLVRYEVSGAPGPAEYLTYEIGDGQAHETNVNLPWAKQFSAASTSGRSFLLSAQGHGSGSLTCRIFVDGRLVSQATASGQPARTVCAPGKT